MLQLDQVSFRYTANSNWAVRDVSFILEPHGLMLLLAPSGSGKTTLVNLITGSLEPMRGSISVGENTTQKISSTSPLELRRSIGFISNDLKLVQDRTVRENIALAMEVLPSERRSAVRQNTDRILERLHLQRIQNFYPASISAADRQRVSIARALVREPLLLIADEPAAMLDNDGMKEIVELLVNENIRGTAMLILTHDERMLQSMPKADVLRWPRADHHKDG